jgi:cytochrome c biogenesis protein
MTIRQLPGSAIRTQADYLEQMALIRDRYEPVLGAGIVGAMERLGLFGVFGAWWFSALLVLLVVSIVACTLDRLPRLWRSAADIRVVQPDPYYDPTLPERAAIDGVEAAAVAAVLRRRRFGVRTETVDGTAYVYGDRNRWMKLATLVTHTGLVLFLVAAAVTSRLGFEAGILIPEGEAVPVQRLGTVGNLVVKNEGFSAPQLPDGRFADFATDLSVYRDGGLVARKTIRVNDPLSVAGFTFHQNFFGPAVDMTIRDLDGSILWTGWVPLDAQSAGRPYGRLAVPGRDLGLELLLDRQEGEEPLLAVIGSRPNGTEADGSARYDAVFAGPLTVGGMYAPPTSDVIISLATIGAYTGIVAKQDPGQGLVWLAFACLIVGLALTFYFPRRRVWARIEPGDRLRLAWSSDRYVSVDRELGGLIDDLVAVRRPGPSPTAGDPAAAPGAADGAAP